MTAKIKESKTASPYVTPGMPPLDDDGKVISAFEFWPTWLIYLPVALQWIVLSLRYRSMTVPFVANPKLELAGMVGVPKSDLLRQASGDCANAILSWFLHVRDDSPLTEQGAIIEAKMQEMGLEYPVVCKPDIGCRGAGVKLVHSQQALHESLGQYPLGAAMMVQRLSTWEPEAGVFYVREPQQQHGRVLSLALKYCPYVQGDGSSTLRELILADARASLLSGLYFPRHADELDKPVAKGEVKRLVFSASHCRGAIFRNAEDSITDALTQRIDSLMKEIPEFYYGRLDIKFSSLEALEKGCNIEIVEINSASAESLHIWDSETSLFSAISALCAQYRCLFRIGDQNRKRGYRPPKLGKLLRNWQLERRLTKHYPETD